MGCLKSFVRYVIASISLLGSNSLVWSVEPSSPPEGSKVALKGRDEFKFPTRDIPVGENLRERFLKLLDRPRVPLNARIEPSTMVNGFTETAFSFDSELGQRVPGLLVRAADATAKSAVVVVLHGTGGSKSGMRPILRKLAANGLQGVAIDGRFAGERSGGAKGAEAYVEAIYQTWKTGRGFPLFYDTVWDTLRLVDYLETCDNVDATKIGAIGFSKGGIELYLAAAADERLRAVVPCIGVQNFGWALEHDAWQSRVSTFQNAMDRAARDAGLAKADAAFVRRFYDRVAPGIAGEFDGPKMLPLIAPRPLLVINGDRDDRTPLPGLQLAITATQAEYNRVGAAKQFEFVLQPNTAHKVTEAAEQQAIEWLVRHLKRID